MAFLLTTKSEMRARNWDAVDFVYVTGDAYVDHPSFGTAIISRLLEAHGYRVGIIAQPDWRDDTSIAALGEPRLGFLVSAGNMDSMVNHFTVAKKRRHRDSYSPGGQSGLRPDRACVVYGNLIRRTFKDTPIILGGIEASLRRLAHYDYWSDKLKRSVLLDSGADIISYGMGEHSVVAIADGLAGGLDVSDITYVPGTVYRARTTDAAFEPLMLPSFEEMQADPLAYARSFQIQCENQNPFLGRTLIEEYPHDVLVVQNPPAEPLTTEEFDEIFELPYERTWHPSYDAEGGVPALEEVRFSLTSNRGCMGDCAFCALSFHQGRIVQARSHESLIAEAEAMTHDPAFKGYIHDVGGPTANFRIPACEAQSKRGACPHKRCLSPQPCDQLQASHEDYRELLRKLRELPKVKKVFVRSGIRYDYVLLDEEAQRAQAASTQADAHNTQTDAHSNRADAHSTQADAHEGSFLRDLVRHHVSGQLRVAPEHVSDAVLAVMGKPPREVYDRFLERFASETKRVGKEQYVVPYLMSSHPGATLTEAVELAEYCRDMGFNPEQVQDFYPTPSTISTCIYYTGVDPRTMKKVYVAKSPHEKALQRALIQYRDPKNHDLAREALRKAGREDLIGFEPECLVRPAKRKSASAQRQRQNTHERAHERTREQAHGRKKRQSTHSRAQGRTHEQAHEQEKTSAHDRGRNSRKRKRRS